jgi:uncharacterized protein DUF3311
VYQMPVDRDGHHDWHNLLQTGSGHPFPDNGAYPYQDEMPGTWGYQRPATHRAPTSQRRPVAAVRTRTRPADASRWHWLLFIPVAVPLLTPLYNRIEPTFLGFPFFYWFQLSLAGLSSLVIALVFALTQKRG